MEDVDGDRAGAGDVTRCLLGWGPDVDDDHIAVVESAGEFYPSDLFESGAISQVRGGEGLEFTMVSHGHVAERRPQVT